MKYRRSLGFLLFIFCCASFAARSQNPDIHLKPVQVPNDEMYWRNAGFAEMVPPTQLPTDKSTEDLIRVWVQLPVGRKITVEWLEEQKRFSLKFPPGSIADRVETMKKAPHAMQVINGIEDVRGARVGDNGETYFHVYEPVPGDPQKFLRGFEWMRSDSKADDLAADRLIALFFPNAGESAQLEIRSFRRLNQCGGCHQPNAPSPERTRSLPPFLSDSHGFFQPMTVLEDTMAVREHRPWDRNADDPFVTVWCGTEQVQATTNGDSRGYSCPADAVPIGKLLLREALTKQDLHALQVCESRKYLFAHMDDKSRAAYRAGFEECSIR